MDETETSNAGLPLTELSSSAADEFFAPVHDCWNRIGVEGNATCRELAKYIHCRNCPVYSAAGLQLLDRPPPADYRRERAEHYAQRKMVSRPARLSVVIFRIAGEWFALPTTAFQEVAEHRVIHTLPHRHRGLALGLVNVRGELLVCASVARLLGLKTSAPGNQSLKSERGAADSGHGFIFDRLLVAGWNGQRVVFPVDEVQGIQRFHKDELKESPATIARSSLTYTEGVFAWGDRSVGLLEAEVFFTALNRSLA
jgi:chemotaxis-related protein WspD